MAYDVIAEKKGAGAFWIARNDDGDICLSLHERQEGISPRRYSTAQAAYDMARARYDLDGDHSAWNAAYHLAILSFTNPLGHPLELER